MGIVLRNIHLYLDLSVVAQDTRLQQEVRIMWHALVTAHFLMSAFTVAKRAWESLSEEF
jgi:hypothetical protein